MSENEETRKNRSKGLNVAIEHWIPDFPRDADGRMNFSAIYYARRYRGKTHSIGHFIMSIFKNEYDRIYIYTTDAGKKEYSRFLASKNIFLEFNPDMIEFLKDRNAHSDNPLNILLIFDDTGSRRGARNPAILDIYIKGRHWNISVIYSIQVPTLADSSWRENADLSFIFKPGTAKIREFLVDNIIAGILPIQFEISAREKNFYRHVVSIITEKEHRMLVVDQRRNKIWKYTAPEFGKPKKRKRSKGKSNFIMAMEERLGII